MTNQDKIDAAYEAKCDNELARMARSEKNIKIFICLLYMGTIFYCIAFHYNLFH